jgi:hypothetical protein
VENVFAALLSLLGIMISGAVAFFVSRRQARNEIVKAKIQIDATYRAKLYEKRLTVYPELSMKLAELGSLIRAGRVPIRIVEDTWDYVRVWDGANSIFMSPLSMTKMIDLRKALVEFTGLKDEFLSNKKSRKELMPAIIELQLALKTELGVMHADGFHSPHRIQRLRETLRADSDAKTDPNGI